MLKKAYTFFCDNGIKCVIIFKYVVNIVPILCMPLY